MGDLKAVIRPPAREIVLPIKYPPGLTGGDHLWAFEINTNGTWITIAKNRAGMPSTNGDLTVSVTNASLLLFRGRLQHGEE